MLRYCEKAVQIVNMNTKGLDFSMDAAPPWVTSALFLKDQAEPKPNQNIWEQDQGKNKSKTGRILDVT